MLGFGGWLTGGAVEGLPTFAVLDHVFTAIIGGMVLLVDKIRGRDVL